MESAKSAVSLSTDISNIVPSGPAAHPAYPEGEACTRRLYCNVTILYLLFGPFVYSSYRYAVHQIKFIQKINKSKISIRLVFQNRILIVCLT